MTTESLIQNQIRVELSKAGYMVFRINVGKVRMADGRWFDTGAPKGFCDKKIIYFFCKTKTLTNSSQGEREFIEDSAFNCIH